jgi:hypothetical protein
MRKAKGEAHSSRTVLVPYYQVYVGYLGSLTHQGLSEPNAYLAQSSTEEERQESLYDSSSKYREV